MFSMKIILATESPYKKELFSRLNLPFSAIASNVDESLDKHKNLSPKDLTRELSYKKAQELQFCHTDAIIIGADQVVCLEEKIFDKPQSTAKAIKQLMQLQGKSHQLITSVCVIQNTKKIIFSNTTNLIMKPFNQAQIENYINFDQPLNCAGSYKIEKMGITLFDKIETNDFTSIIGLPLIQLTKALNEFNISVL